MLLSACPASQTAAITFYSYFNIFSARLPSNREAYLQLQHLNNRGGQQSRKSVNLPPCACQEEEEEESEACCRATVAVKHQLLICVALLISNNRAIIQWIADFVQFADCSTSASTCFPLQMCFIKQSSVTQYYKLCILFGIVHLFETLLLQYDFQ